MKFTDRSNRPKAVKPQPHSIPEELKSVKQFVLWSYTWSVRAGAWAKVPFTVEGSAASTTDADTWSTFDECWAALEENTRYDGIGFVFTDSSPYVGIDIDNCISGGEVNPIAKEIVSGLNSYCEVSPSQSGLHVIGRADDVTAAKGTWRGLELEVYRNARYFTMTGRTWAGHTDVNDIGKLASDLSMFIKQEAAKKSAASSVDRQLKKALKDPYIKALFDGDVSEYEGDQSRADLALCAKLAPYSGMDRNALDRMFRQSKLFRDKWDERHGADTYGNLTMDKALDGQVSAPAVKEFSRDTRQAGRITVESMIDQVMTFREDGGSRGFDPGWTGLGRYYRPTLGGLTVMVGEPSSGKSTWIDVLTYNMAKLHGWRSAMASFESLPVERHINSLCQIHLQKPTYTYMPGHATDAEMGEALKWLNDWFTFLMPDDDSLTVDSILEYVQDEIDDHGIKGFVLDPFTEVELQQTAGMSEVQVIKNDLKKIQQFTRSQEIHTWLLAHPTKGGETFKQEEKGMRPTLYSAAGAAHFRNKADFGLVIHRWDDDVVSMYVDKVRNDSTGGRGKVDFRYNIDRREYEEIKEDRW